MTRFTKTNCHHYVCILIINPSMISCSVKSNFNPYENYFAVTCLHNKLRSSSISVLGQITFF